MAVHQLTRTLLFIAWSILMPSLGHPQQHPCRLIHKAAFCNNGKLSYVPTHLPNNIEELQLNNNEIKTLLNNSLPHYTFLSTLSLAGNILERLQSNSFQDTQELESLFLADNKLNIGYQETSLALLKLPRLRVLDISGNEFNENMASILLENLTSLEYLNLSRNILLRLDERSFRNLHQLKELDLQRNLLFEIDSAFNNTPKLQRLNLAFNYLPCLIDFHMTQLMVLNASHNSIEWFIASQDIYDTFNLETLDLSNNKLLFFPFLPSHSRLRNLYLSQNLLRFYEHLADNLTSSNSTTSIKFYSLNGKMRNVTAQLWDEGLHGDISSLEVLDLRGNLVGYLPKGFISKMPHLSRLKMCTNCLEVLDFTSGHFSGSLYELDVSNNRLSNIVSDHGKMTLLGNLTYLNLSLNNLERVPSRLFSSLPSLRSVDLSYNNIGICLSEEISSITSDCVVWKHIKSLRHLYLKGCKLKRVPISAFSGMLLSKLDLSDNQGLILDSRSIQSLSRTLQHLGLGNTDIQIFDFSPFLTLRSLNMSGNSLIHLPSSLRNLELQMLDLRDNKLSTIPSVQAKSLAQKHLSVFLTGNPFNCCQMEWYTTFESAKTVIMVDKTDISCQDVTSRTYRVELFQSRLCAHQGEESSLWYILLILPACLLFVVISVIFILTFKRKQLHKSFKKHYFRPTTY